MAGWRNRNATELSAYQRALGLLVRREHSRKELGRKLSAKGIEREDADLALDKLNNQANAAWRKAGRT